MRLAIVALLLAVAGCGTDAVVGDGGADLSVPIRDLSMLPRPDLGCPPGGSACSVPSADCYGFEIACHCSATSHTWFCCDDSGLAPCPQTPPSEHGCCDGYPALGCSYACTGGVATACTCTADGWHCTTMPCD
jgi:hypothetical protein